MTNKTVLLIRNITPDNYGGAEKYQLELSKLMCQHNLSPIIISSSKKLREDANKSHIKNLKAPYFRIQNWGGIRRIFLPIYIIWQIRLYFWYKKVIRRYKPIAIQLQSRDDLIAGTLAAKKMGVRSIWTDHSDLRKVVWLNIDQGKNPIGRYILKLAKYPYRITTVSNHEHAAVQKLIAPAKLTNFIVVQNGVIDTKIKEKVVPNSICYVGRITKEKGVGELLNAFCQVSNHFPQATLDLYGNGPELEYYKTCIKDNRHIKFHGYADDPLLEIARHKIFVLPSYHEGLSLSLLEASMLSKAIIATNIDGNSEIVINNKTGLLVPVKDTRSLADAIIELLNNPKKAEKLAKNARKLYEEQYNFEKIFVNQILPLYMVK